MNILRFFLAGFLLILAAVVLAHPEDEFCVPGEGSLDPALCAALSEMDRPGEAGFASAAELSGRSAWSTAVLYTGIGVGHILPGGLDHILFVLALFLTSLRLKSLVIQISTFTVAHTATLGLAAAGVLSPDPAIVEPLIAATIAFVAIENLFVKKMPAWRPVLVFGFGLLHGLGFAGFFGELGLPSGQFWSALIGFNIGVEIGQLSIVLAAALLVALVRHRIAGEVFESLYRRWVVLPGSAVIGLTGLIWAVQRI